MNRARLLSLVGRQWSAHAHLQTRNVLFGSERICRSLRLFSSSSWSGETKNERPAEGKQFATGEEEKKENTTHFGFQEVPEQEKASKVGGVFANVAIKYDVMNDLMSGGLHRLWKDQFVSDLGPTPDMRIVDVAGGTGDIAFRIIDSMRKTGGQMHPVTVLDASPAMLEVGRKRSTERGYDMEVEFKVDDAEVLENVEDESVDAYVISFGMRNVTHPAKALEQAHRVLKKGGRFMMLEFARVRNRKKKAPSPWYRDPTESQAAGEPQSYVEQIYDAYSYNVIPSIGEAVASDRDSYRYLVESIRRFPGQEEFCSMMKDASLKQVSSKDYTFGVVAQYSGFKL